MFSSVSNARKREYEERINIVDNGSLTPMVLASTGGTGTEMSMALKVLAEKLAEKENEAYSHVMGDIRARFAFAIARSSLICLRGSRSIWSPRQMELIEEHDDCSSQLLMADTTRY
jgi:hypothetical protein